MLKWNVECFCCQQVKNLEYFKLFDIKYGKENPVKVHFQLSCRIQACKFTKFEYLGKFQNVVVIQKWIWDRVYCEIIWQVKTADLCHKELHLRCCNASGYAIVFFSFRIPVSATNFKICFKCSKIGAFENNVGFKGREVIKKFENVF